MEGLRAIMVSVDYEDLLAVTLPYNRHHFSEVLVVTDTAHERTVRDICLEHHADVYATDRFYALGAEFNKWAALEEALDVFGRRGWICNMDADVLWPKVAPLEPRIGELWAPLRHMAPWPVSEHPGPIGLMPPQESNWYIYPIHRNVGEWAGYSQIFHAEDPALGPAPWHEVDWRHAGGADSFFQRKWPMTLKRRPSWNVLHLGEAGKNWYGRATTRADGSEPDGAGEKLGRIDEIWRGRRAIRAEGREEAAQFAPEKLGGGG